MYLTPQTTTDKSIFKDLQFTASTTILRPNNAFVENRWDITLVFVVTTFILFQDSTKRNCPFAHNEAILSLNLFPESSHISHTSFPKDTIKKIK